MPYSAALTAVISAPPVRAASTTTTAADSPAMMRLRGGNRHPSGGDPRRVLGHDRTTGVQELLTETLVLARIRDVDAAPEHAHADATRVDQSSMRFTVDASCQA